MKSMNLFIWIFLNKKEDIIGGDLCILKDILCHWKLNNIYTLLDYLV
jgi:hypothetical protein